MSKVHIALIPEKCGSVTMRDLIYRLYLEETICDVRRSVEYDGMYRKLQMMPMESVRKYQVICGHLHYGIHRLLYDDFRYFGLVRHPVDRVVSCYKSYRRKKDHPLHEYANRYSLKQFIEKKIRIGFDNGMTRVLSDVWPNELKYGEVSDVHLQQAKENVRKHFLMGSVKEYDASLLYFACKLGWPRPFYSKANFARGNDNVEMDRELIDLILVHNQHDLQLYLFAKKRFFEEISVIPDFKRKVKTFQNLNLVLNVFYAGARLRRFKKKIL